VARQYLAFDLGAESGRAIAAKLAEDGTLTVREICRFPNQPIRERGALRWNALGLWGDITRALDGVGETRFDSIGVDAWGVDYALLDERGTLLENPYHYRDARNVGTMEEVFARVSRDRLYAVTGIQFIQINTLFQLYAASRQTPNIVETAQSLVTIPDLFNYWLTGELVTEYTSATTTQCVDACTRQWAIGLVEEVGLPTRLLRPIVEPGTVIGAVRPSASPALAGTPVVAPACHDTASAVAAIDLDGRTAFLSSGTWSLLGAEMSEPILSPKARDLNFTNEGGAAGTIRLLKNINGLWLLQACRRVWHSQGTNEPYDELLAGAADPALAFRSLVDPDHALFLNPADMTAAIASYCRQSAQPEPETRAAFARAIFESLALKYRLVLDRLEELTGRRFTELRVVGGGSRNRLLNQLTADATGRVVLTGPGEATALGNVAMQMVATGAVTSLGEARRTIARSFPAERFEPAATERWEAPYRRFLDYVECGCA